jgi:hypothetical protein
MPGPAPKWDLQRRRNEAARVGPVMLPAEGRSGPAPRWPLAGKLHQHELQTWRELWTAPQAVVWEQQGSGCARVVARYVRVLMRAESIDSVATDMAEARQLEDKLGLTPVAMRRMLWRIVEDEVAEQRVTSNARGRIRAVDQEGKG